MLFSSWLNLSMTANFCLPQNPWGRYGIYGISIDSYLLGVQFRMFMITYIMKYFCYSFTLAVVTLLDELLINTIISCSKILRKKNIHDINHKKKDFFFLIL